MVSDAGALGRHVPIVNAGGAAGAKTRLRWRDLYFLFSPLIVPYLVYRRGYSLLNSVAFVMYFGYAAILTLNAKRITREQLYLILGLVLITAQLVLRVRSGLNSSLSLVAMVVVYDEVTSRIGATVAIKLTIVMYAINLAYMTLELLSQFGIVPALQNIESAAWSIVPPLQVGASIYMQEQASALVALAAMAGAIAGVTFARTPRQRTMFIVAGAISLILAVINIRGTSLIAFVFAVIVIAIVKFGKRGFLALVAFFGVVAAIVSANMDAIVQVLGFRFVDPNTGFIDQAIVDTYLDMFLSIYNRWHQSSIGDRLLGQGWDFDIVGEFGLGTMLYTEGLIITTIYLCFVFYECWRAFRMPHRKVPRNAIVYANVVALVLYVASLTHYTNALNIGVANLMAMHIALNIALTRSTFRPEDAWLIADSRSAHAATVS